MVTALTVTLFSVGAPGAAAAGGGSQLWTLTYGDRVHGYDRAVAAAASSNGDVVYVTGYRGDGHRTGDIVTIEASAATGHVLWKQAYDGPDHREDGPEALGVSPGGSVVFVTGSSMNVANVDIVTLAYDAASGAPLWSTRFDGQGHLDDYASGLAVSSDGTTVFVGGSTDTSNGEKYATVAYDASTGGQLWVSTYASPGGGSGNGATAIASAGSGVYVTGTSTGTDFDFATVAYDARTGAQQWVARFDNGDADLATGIGVAVDQSTVSVTGYTTGTDLNRAFETIAYDASSGGELWAERYTPIGQGSGEPLGLAMSPDGARIFVTGGQSSLNAGADYLTLAYDTLNGSQLWVSSFNGPANGDDSAEGVAVNPNGSRVYVIGLSESVSGGFDIETIAYDAATGSGIWAARFGGPGIDLPNGLAVDPAGNRVFVTGEYGRVGGSLDADWVVLAYAG
jgi:hypothetical protein